jgi:hypothetical protein
VAYWLNARIVEPAETAVAMKRLCKQTLVARQWLDDQHLITETVLHATIAELLEGVLSVRLYNEEQLPYELIWRQQLVSEIQLKDAGLSRMNS